MITEEILNHLAALNPNARILNEFKEALIGIVARPLDKPVAVYSLEKIIAGLMERESIDRDTASLLVQKHFLRTNMGKGAPVFLIEAISKDYRIGLDKASEESQGEVVAPEKKLIVPE